MQARDGLEDEREKLQEAKQQLEALRSAQGWVGEQVMLSNNQCRRTGGLDIEKGLRGQLV
jgi:hypothetical protein